MRTLRFIMLQAHCMDMWWYIIMNGEYIRITHTQSPGLWTNSGQQ